MSSAVEVLSPSPGPAFPQEIELLRAAGPEQALASELLDEIKDNYCPLEDPPLANIGFMNFGDRVLAIRVRLVGARVLAVVWWDEDDTLVEACFRQRHTGRTSQRFSLSDTSRQIPEEVRQALVYVRQMQITQKED